MLAKYPPITATIIYPSWRVLTMTSVWQRTPCSGELYKLVCRILQEPEPAKPISSSINIKWKCTYCSCEVRNNRHKQDVWWRRALCWGLLNNCCCMSVVVVLILNSWIRRDTRKANERLLEMNLIDRNHFTRTGRGVCSELHQATKSSNSWEENKSRVTASSLAT